jgi:hypothetical protein
MTDHLQKITAAWNDAIRHALTALPQKLPQGGK